MTPKHETDVTVIPRSQIRIDLCCIDPPLRVKEYFLLKIAAIISLMMIAFITVNSGLVPLIEGLCSSNP